MAQVDETDNDADAVGGEVDQASTTAKAGETAPTDRASEIDDDPEPAAEADATAEPPAGPAVDADAAADAEAVTEIDAAAAKPKKRRRRKRAATAAVVGAAIDSMDTSPTPEDQADDATEPLASATVSTMPLDDVEVAARRGIGARLALGCLAVVIVLAIGAALGFGAASLVPGFADASAPAVTLPPATERPTPPPIPTARPSPTASPTPSPVPSPTPLVHTVKRGENLTQIANRYGVTVAQIVAANALKNANLIEVGQKLVIPTPTPEP